MTQTHYISSDNTFYNVRKLRLYPHYDLVVMVTKLQDGVFSPEQKHVKLSTSQRENRTFQAHSNAT